MIGFHLWVAVVVEVLAQATLCGYLSVVLKMVEHLAWAQVSCRVIRGLVLELKLYIKHCSWAWVLTTVIEKMLWAPFNCTFQMSLVCLDETNYFILLCLSVWSIFSLNRTTVWRHIEGFFWDCLKPFQENSVQISWLVGVACLCIILSGF